MITAKTFASLGSVWHIVAPSMEQFTRWINRQHGWYGPHVQRLGETRRSALIAETGFELAITHWVDGDLSPEDRAAAFIARLSDSVGEHEKLSPSERYEAVHIARNIAGYLPEVGESASPVVAHPTFPGCGYVQAGVGDLLIGTHLIEVKTVERGFRGIDLRQALTYAALAYSSGMEINEITLLNPRRGFYFAAQVTSLARDLGAVSWIDLMHNVVNEMTDVSPSQ